MPSLAPEKLAELHDAIHADIRTLAAPDAAPPSHRPMVSAALPASILGFSLTAIAGQVVPILTDVALKAIGPAVEAFADSHAAWVRQFVSTSALEFAAKVIKDLESAPAPAA